MKRLMMTALLLSLSALATTGYEPNTGESAPGTFGPRQEEEAIDVQPKTETIEKTSPIVHPEEVDETEEIDDSLSTGEVSGPMRDGRFEKREPATIDEDEDIEAEEEQELDYSISPGRRQ